MVNLEILKNRLMQFLSSTVSLFIRDRAVATPRFTYVTRLDKKDSGPDPESFGVVYRDEQTKTGYLIDQVTVTAKGVRKKAVFSIKEIISRPEGLNRFDEAAFANEVKTQIAPIDIQEEMISFFKIEALKSGGVFDDKRTRQTQTDSGLSGLTSSVHNLG